MLWVDKPGPRQLREKSTTPNSLKLNTWGDKAPSGLFTLPQSANDLMSKIKKKYKLFYEVWNTNNISLITKRQKWHFEEEKITFAISNWRIQLWVPNG